MGTPTLQSVPPDRKEFLRRRQAGIGSSDIAAIMGVDPYRTPLDVYNEKMGLVADEPLEGHRARGVFLEPLIADIYAEKMGRKIRRTGQRSLRGHPWAIANLDRDILADGTHPTGCLEVKAPGIHAFQQIRLHGFTEYFICQTQWQLAVTGRSWGSWAVFDSEQWRLVTVDFQTDRELQILMLEKASAFWHDHVLAGIVPETTTEPLVKLPAVGGEVTLRDDTEFAEAVANYIEGRDLEKSGKDLKAVARDQLKAVLDDFGAFQGADARVHYSQRTRAGSFNRKALTAHRPVDALKVAAELQSRGVDLDLITEAIEESRLDLTLFEGQPSTYEDLRVFSLKGGDE